MQGLHGAVCSKEALICSEACRGVRPPFNECSAVGHGWQAKSLCSRESCSRHLCVG